MLDIRDLLKPALRLFIICFVTAFSLAFVNFITKDTISLRAEQEAEEQRKIVMAEADSFEKLEGWKELDESGLISAVYAAYTGDKLAGYVFSASPSGFGGKIAVTVGISKDKKISGVMSTLRTVVKVRARRMTTAITAPSTVIARAVRASSASSRANSPAR